MKNPKIIAVMLMNSVAVFGCPTKATTQGGRASIATAKVSSSGKSSHHRAAFKPAERGRRWQAATYRGLVVAKSTREEMLRALGEPFHTSLAAGQVEDASKPIIWNEYGWHENFEGTLTVEIDKGSNRIVGMILQPVNLSREDAIKHFGKGYVVTRYEFATCPGQDEEDGAPLYESPTGQFTYIEYRDLGIAIKLGERNKVREIIYLSENDAIGAESPKCQPN